MELHSLMRIVPTKNKQKSKIICYHREKTSASTHRQAKVTLNELKATNGIPV